MASLNIFVISLVLAVAFNFVQCSNDGIESNIEVLTVSDISDFMLKHPDVKVQPLEEKILPSGASPYIQKQYTIGYRIQGDHLLASQQESQQWSQTRDVNTNLHYPQNGIGAVITYLEVICEQSSFLGQAYIVAGGVGQRQIAIVIEARQTLYFSYRASIFGY